MVNKAIIIGRNAKLPELMKTKTDMSIARLSIATNKKYKGQEKTEWHRVVLFGKMAEFAATKIGVGALLYIEGELRTHNWKDKTGHDHYTTEIIANELKVQTWGKTIANNDPKTSTYDPQFDDTGIVNEPVVSDDFFMESDVP